jgi:hypothetical protein
MNLVCTIYCLSLNKPAFLTPINNKHVLLDFLISLQK